MNVVMITTPEVTHLFKTQQNTITKEYAAEVLSDDGIEIDDFSDIVIDVYNLKDLERI